MTTKVVPKRGTARSRMALARQSIGATHWRRRLAWPWPFRSLTVAIAPRGAAGEKPPVLKHGAPHPARQASLASRPHLRRLHIRDKV